MEQGEDEYNDKKEEMESEEEKKGEENEKVVEDFTNMLGNPKKRKTKKAPLLEETKD